MTREHETNKWPEIFDQYNESNKWLESLIRDPLGLAYLKIRTPEEIRRSQETKMGRMKDFLDYLGNPQNEYQAVHVTGTSGKGSVCTLASSLLREAVPSVGLHTSPYVQLPIEKLIIDGKMIKPSVFSTHVNEIRKQFEQYANTVATTSLPNYAEVWTTLVHYVFAKEHLRWGVFEVGMGGRFDASNIINTQVAVINNVDYDHMEYIGPTLEDIAWHKSGVIKPGKPTITGVTQPELLEIIRKEAEKNQSPLYVIDDDFRVEKVQICQKGIRVDLLTPFGSYKDIYINLSGQFQGQNAATALTSIQLALSQEGLSLSDSQIKHAFSEASLPGRFEIMQECPLVIIDGAHNPAKIAALVEILKSHYGDKDITLVIGMLKTKDAAGSLTQLLPLVKEAYATEPGVIGKPSTKAADLADTIHRINGDLKVKPNADVKNAIGEALEDIEDNEKQMVVVTGSMYMLGKARSYWKSSEKQLYDLEFGL